MDQGSLPFIKRDEERMEREGWLSPRRAKWSERVTHPRRLWRWLDTDVHAGERLAADIEHAIPP